MFTTATAILLGSASLTHAVSPKDVLKDEDNTKTFENGVTIRKGTVAATYANAKLFEAMAQGGAGELQDLRSEQAALVPALDQVGFYAFYGAEKMLDPDPTREGRAWIALLYYALNPELVTPEIAQKIEVLKKNSSKLLASEIGILFSE